MLKSENPAAHGQHLKIYFDGTGTVTKIEGLETIQNRNQVYLLPKKQF